jgi:hypothetical protein
MNANFSPQCSVFRSKFPNAKRPQLLHPGTVTIHVQNAIVPKYPEENAVYTHNHHADTAGLATGSSDEFDIERYAVQKIPIVATKGYRRPGQCCEK